MLRPKALDHVGLKVTDMDKTLRFYQRLGLTLLRTSGPNADGLRSAVIQVGSQELNVFSHPDFVPSGKENPVGMDHFCLLVDAASVDDVIVDLQQAGIDIVRGLRCSPRSPACRASGTVSARAAFSTAARSHSATARS